MIFIALAVLVFLVAGVVRLAIHVALRAAAIVLLVAAFLFFGACSGFSAAFRRPGYFAAAQAAPPAVVRVLP